MDIKERPCEIKSISDFLGKIKTIRSDYKSIIEDSQREEEPCKKRRAVSNRKADNPTPRLWFRGDFGGLCNGYPPRLPEPSLLRPGCPGPSQSRIKDPVTKERLLDTLTIPRTWFEKEQLVVSMLQSRGGPIIEATDGYRPRTQLDWAFVAQHHGMPTRLLDWSAAALTALYFATTNPCKYQICDSGIDSNSLEQLGGVVWVLEPRLMLDRQKRTDDTHVRASFYGVRSILHEYFLEDEDIFTNHKTTRFSSINEAAIIRILCEHQGFKFPPELKALSEGEVGKLFNGSGIGKRFIGEFGMPTNNRIPGPIPIMPAHQLNRVNAQQSRFTLHPFRERALEALPDSGALNQFLRPIIIPNGVKDTIADELRGLGVNAFSLFPDIDHLAVYHNKMEDLYSG